MELTQAIELIKNKSITSSYKTGWADLGCGKGLFTAALAHLLEPGSIVYSVDKNRNSLNQLPSLINGVIVEKIQADFFKEPLSLENLDGIIMANSLHFVKDKISFIHKAQKWLKGNGLLMVAEYDMDKANPWVPYPLSFHSLTLLFEKMGYSVEKIHQRPSIFHRAGIYSALIHTGE